ncbi:non-ribosomal peptide synthetase, partial [Pedobacter steynii]
MMIKDLLKDLKYKNIELSVSGADLDVNYQTEELPEDVITLIRRHKTEIISFLNQISGNLAIENTPLLSNYVLSSSQRRLWLLSQFEGGDLAYNVMGAFVFEGELDKPAFAQSFTALIDRHESLRTVFREAEDEEVRQFILNTETIGFRIDEQDLRSAGNQEEVLQGLVGREFRYPFLLSEGPLLRAGLYQVADHQWVFTYVMHHIISDGLSMDILIRELLLFYNSAVKGELLALAPLRIQYKDYAAWQQSQLSGDLLKSHKGYWLGQFSGTVPVLDLAGDQPRPLIKTYNGGRTDLLIQQGLGAGIRSLSQAEGGTMFMGLLAALNILLYRYTGQEDIIVGSPIAGREHADLEEQIGIYINTLALRSRFKSTDDYRTVLRQVRQLTLDAYEHQVYPFDELVDALDLKRDMSRNPLFDVGLILQQSDPSAKSAEPQLAGLRVRSYNGAENVISKFDLCFSFNEAGDALYLGIEYNSDIYHPETVNRMGRHLEGLLAAIVKDPGAAISSLDYLEKKEKEDLLAAAPSLPVMGNVVELLEAQVL